MEGDMEYVWIFSFLKSGKVVVKYGGRCGKGGKKCFHIKYILFYCDRHWSLNYNNFILIWEILK